MQVRRIFTGLIISAGGIDFARNLAVAGKRAQRLGQATNRIERLPLADFPAPRFGCGLAPATAALGCHCRLHSVNRVVEYYANTGARTR